MHPHCSRAAVSVCRVQARILSKNRPCHRGLVMRKGAPDASPAAAAAVMPAHPDVPPLTCNCRPLSMPALQCRLDACAGWVANPDPTKCACGGCTTCYALVGVGPAAVCQRANAQQQCARCAEDDPARCADCIPGWSLLGGTQCQPCTTPNCASCEPDSAGGQRCVSCLDGWALNTTGAASCVPCLAAVSEQGRWWRAGVPAAYDSRSAASRAATHTRLPPLCVRRAVARACWTRAAAARSGASAASRGTCCGWKTTPAATPAKQSAPAQTSDTARTCNIGQVHLIQITNQLHIGNAFPASQASGTLLSTAGRRATSARPSPWLGARPRRAPPFQLAAAARRAWSTCCRHA